MSSITEKKYIRQNVPGTARTRCWRRANTAVLAGITMLCMCPAAGAQDADTGAAMADPQARAGYSAGYKFGSQLAGLKRQQPGVELEAVFQGILDALSGAKPKLNAAEMDTALKSIERSNTPPRPRARVRGYKDDFVALNAKREGVVTLPSGVQYEILKPGTGKQPTAVDAVLVSYQGSLTTGAVFDSTYEDGKPARLQLDDIAVPGLKEALLLMNQGAKWRVVIPPSMGFARSGNNQLRRRDLIYEIELVAIEAAANTVAKPAAAATVPVSTPAPGPAGSTTEPDSPEVSPAPGQDPK